MRARKGGVTFWLTNLELARELFDEVGAGLLSWCGDGRKAFDACAKASGRDGPCVGWGISSVWLLVLTSWALRRPCGCCESNYDFLRGFYG